MRTQQFFLLAAAVALAAGRRSNMGPQECGSCNKCCANGLKYKKTALNDEVCEDPATGGSCDLCALGSGNVCNAANVKGLGFETEIYQPDASTQTGMVGVLGSRGDLKTGQRVFDDLYVTEAIFSVVPSHMENIISNQFPWDMPLGFKYRFHCDPNDANACDAYIMFYTCVDCPTGKSAELAAALVSDGWQRLSCAVSFRLLPDAQNYGFITYTKEIQKGVTVTEEFEFPHDIRFVASGWNRRKLELCSSIYGTDDCNDLDGCKWDTHKDLCVPGCPPLPRNTGPWGCPCPVDEYNSSRLVTQIP